MDILVFQAQVEGEKWSLPPLHTNCGRFFFYYFFYTDISYLLIKLYPKTSINLIIASWTADSAQGIKQILQTCMDLVVYDKNLILFSYCMRDDNRDVKSVGKQNKMCTSSVCACVNVSRCSFISFDMHSRLVQHLKSHENISYSCNCTVVTFAKCYRDDFSILAFRLLLTLICSPRGKHPRL